MDDQTGPKASAGTLPTPEGSAHDRTEEAQPDRVQSPKTRKFTPETKQRQVNGRKASQIANKANRIKLRNNQVAKWMAMKSVEPRLTVADASKRLNLNVHTLRKYIFEATKDGTVTFDDAVDRLSYEIIPKVMDNLKEFVEKKDRVVTLETAKGTVFKQFQAQQGIQDGGQMVLALKIETTPNDEPRTIAGVIVGRAKEIPDGSE